MIRAAIDAQGPILTLLSAAPPVWFDPAITPPKRNSPIHDSGKSSSPRYLLPNAALLRPPTGLMTKAKNCRKNPGEYPFPSRIRRDMRKSASPSRLPPKGVLTMSLIDGGWISMNCSQRYEPTKEYATDS